MPVRGIVGVPWSVSLEASGTWKVLLAGGLDALTLENLVFMPNWDICWNGWRQTWTGFNPVIIVCFWLKLCNVKKQNKTEYAAPWAHANVYLFMQYPKALSSSLEIDWFTKGRGSKFSCFISFRWQNVLFSESQKAKLSPWNGIYSLSNILLSWVQEQEASYTNYIADFHSSHLVFFE